MAINRSISNINVDDSADNGKVPVFNSTTKVFDMAVAGSGVTTMGAIGASANANGATITGSTLNLEPASASFGGVVTTGTQTFAGAKTFSSSIVGSAGLSIVGAGSFSASSAGMVFGGATTVYSSVSVSTSAGSTLATGIGSARVLMGTATVTTFTSGTHPLIAGLVLKPQTITNAGATVTNTATLYVESAGAGGTNNYAAWFDSGAVRIDGTIELGHASDTTLSRVSAGVVAIEGINIVTTSSTDTLTNKTLTAPKFADLGFIADANGNEMLIFDTVASAVNEITLANAATTGTPTISATGGDSNINIQLTPKGTGIVKGELKRFMVRLLANTTDTATGTSIGGDYRISNRAITVKAVGAYVDTAGTTNTTTIDINEAGSTILSTKITIDSTEKSSETAATPPVISDTAIAADAVVTFDIDAINTTPAKGLTVWIDYVFQ